MNITSAKYYKNNGINVSVNVIIDEDELLAISKLANPIQSPKDLDIVFNIQFDT